MHCTNLSTALNSECTHNILPELLPTVFWCHLLKFLHILFAKKCFMIVIRIVLIVFEMDFFTEWLYILQTTMLVLFPMKSQQQHKQS